MAKTTASVKSYSAFVTCAALSPPFASPGAAKASFVPGAAISGAASPVGTSNEGIAASTRSGSEGGGTGAAANAAGSGATGGVVWATSNP